MLIFQSMTGQCRPTQRDIQSLAPHPLATSVSVTYGNGPGARNERIEDEAQALCGGVHHPLRIAS